MGEHGASLPHMGTLSVATGPKGPIQFIGGISVRPQPIVVLGSAFGFVLLTNIIQKLGVNHRTEALTKTMSNGIIKL